MRSCTARCICSTRSWSTGARAITFGAVAVTSLDSEPARPSKSPRSRFLPPLLLLLLLLRLMTKK